MNSKKMEEHPCGRRFSRSATAAAFLTIRTACSFSRFGQLRPSVVDYQIVKDDKAEIERHLHEWVCSVDLVITSGGTGLAKRDVTIETVEPLFDKKIPAFQSMMTYFAYRRACGVQAMATGRRLASSTSARSTACRDCRASSRSVWKKSFCRKSFICIRKSRSKWKHLTSSLSPAGRGVVKAPLPNAMLPPFPGGMLMWRQPASSMKKWPGASPPTAGAAVIVADLGNSGRPAGDDGTVVPVVRCGPRRLPDSLFF